jgi:hypothetical protein
MEKHHQERLHGCAGLQHYMFMCSETRLRKRSNNILISEGGSCRARWGDLRVVAINLGDLGLPNGTCQGTRVWSRASREEPFRRSPLRPVFAQRMYKLVAKRVRNETYVGDFSPNFFGLFRYRQVTVFSERRECSRSGIRADSNSKCRPPSVRRQCISRPSYHVVPRSTVPACLFRKSF